MDYDAIAQHFLIPTGDPAPVPQVPGTAARQLRDATEAIATIGWWAREAAGASTALGHGFFDGYVWGRAAALGADVDASVVVAAFGVFNAALLGPVYAHGRTISSRDAILAARADGAIAGLRAATTGVDDALIRRLGDRLLDAVLAVPAGSRPLFAALQALPVPADPHGRLWRAAELVREHRGDGHLAACAVSGLDAVEANVLTELWLGYSLGEYSSSRGFDAAALADAVASLQRRGWVSDGPVLTDAGRAARAAIEELTDRSQQQLIDVLGESVEWIVAAANEVTASILAHHAAPADVRKRAAG